MRFLLHEHPKIPCKKHDHRGACENGYFATTLVHFRQLKMPSPADLVLAAGTSDASVSKTID
jgi:hypothetical protein